MWPKGRYMYMKVPGRGIGNRHEARPVYEDPEGPIPRERGRPKVCYILSSKQDRTLKRVWDNLIYTSKPSHILVHAMHKGTKGRP